MRATALVVFAIGFWGTAVMPEYVTSLLFLLIATVSRVAPTGVVFSGFHSTAIWLVFGGLVLAAAVEKTGLGNRMANWLLGFFGTSYLGVISGIVLIGMLFAFFIPSTMGRVVLLVPVVLSMADGLGLEEGSPGRNGMVIAATLGCFAPSCAVLPANVPNMVLAGAAENLYNLRFSYAKYLGFHYPVLGLLKGVSIVILTCVLLPAQIQMRAAGKRGREKPFSAHEWVMTFILAGTLLLWGTDFLHGVSPAWVALAAALICLLPLLRLLPASALGRDINLTPFFYVAGILGLGALVAKTGLGEIFGAAILEIIPFEPGQDLRNFVLLVTLSTTISPLTTAAGLPAVITPLSAHIATATGFPLLTVLMSQVIGISNIIFPYQIAPVVVGMHLGGVRAAQGLRMTLALGVVSLLVLLPLNYLWWSLLGVF
jgi:anion transporter